MFFKVKRRIYDSVTGLSVPTDTLIECSEKYAKRMGTRILKRINKPSDDAGVKVYVVDEEGAKGGRKVTVMSRKSKETEPEDPDDTKDDKPATDDKKAK